jgi:hypothetical protein
MRAAKGLRIVANWRPICPNQAEGLMYCFAPVGTTMQQPEAVESALPKCARCGSAMAPLYSFLDPRSGKQVRAFECDCGDRTWIMDRGTPEFLRP